MFLNEKKCGRMVRCNPLGESHCELQAHQGGGGVLEWKKDVFSGDGGRGRAAPVPHPPLVYHLFLVSDREEWAMILEQGAPESDSGKGDPVSLLLGKPVCI